MHAPSSPASAHQAAADREVTDPDTRAVVLAGAGSTGHAWELGLVAGLADAGIDLTEADLVVGTSAGSTVAAQITSGTQAGDLYAAILAEATPPRRDGGAAPPPRRGRAPSVPSYLDWSAAVIEASTDPSDMRRRLGVAALAKEASDGPLGTRWRDVVAARLPRHDWPRQRVLITAVDADTGEPVEFDRHSGVDLVDAVAASTSNGFAGPHRVGGCAYLNGGYRRNENADLAVGYGRVVVLSPFGGRSRHPDEWGMDLAAQVDDLRASGSRVEPIVPGNGSAHMFGANAMDPTLRPLAARAGYAQGRELAERLRPFWG